jgi:hypothetical protein
MARRKMIIFEICFAKEKNGVFSLALFFSIAGTPVWITSKPYGSLDGIG